MDRSTARKPSDRDGDVGEVHAFFESDRGQREEGLDERIDAGTENLRAVAADSDARDTVTWLLRELRELTTWALREAEEASEDLLAAAERDAEERRRQADSEAEKIVADARERAQELIDDAQADHDRTQAEVGEVRQMIARLQVERNDLEDRIKELTTTRTEAERELSGVKLAVEGLLEVLASVHAEAPPEHGASHEEATVG